MNGVKRELLTGDLRRLKAELPQIIAGVKRGDADAIDDGLTLIKLFGHRANQALDRLTTEAVERANNGDSSLVRAIASGEFFE
jgi:hypothetical protein